MKHIFSLAVILAGMASAALALPAVPARPHLEAIQIIYGSDPALRCFNAARDGVELRNGLDFCNTAVIDPLMNHRAETLVNRGIILYNLGNRNDALADFNTAITYNPSLGDAYLNRAMVLISLNRNPEALDAINRGIALGASNLQLAYYNRAEIEEDAGRYAEAYRDYMQALAIKPDYAAAESQLQRFQIRPRSTNSP